MLREELAICRRYLIPYSQWRGGPAEWSDDDRAKATAYERWLAEACPRCGTRHEDWYEPDGELRREPVWEPVMRDCRGCEQREALGKHLSEDSRRSGAYVAFIPHVDFDPHAEMAREGRIAPRRP